ncbi:MAG TPA: transketolase C-terminal domain-containing protein, partial [Nitrospiria bacterium]
DLRTLSPMDSETILASARKTGRIVIVHEAPRTGGLGGEIAALISERALEYLEAPIVRVTGFDVAVPLPKMEKYYLPNIERVLQAVHHVMEF